MGTRYADEKIGEITDDEVIFKTGERFFLKEISKAVYEPIWIFIVLGIFCYIVAIFLLYTMRNMPWWYNLFPGAGVISGCVVGYVFLVQCPHHRIVLKAKNGGNMYTCDTTDGKQFVERLNRYIG